MWIWFVSRNALNKRTPHRLYRTLSGNEKQIQNRGGMWFQIKLKKMFKSVKNENKSYLPFSHSPCPSCSAVRFPGQTRSPGDHGKSRACRAPQRRPFSCLHAWPVQGQYSALCPVTSEWPGVTPTAWGQIQMPASNFTPTGLSVQICPKIWPPSP